MSIEQQHKHRRGCAHFNVGCMMACVCGGGGGESWATGSVAKYQEDGQLEVIVEHDGLHAARPAQPRCDFTQEVSVEDEEKGT